MNLNDKLNNNNDEFGSLNVKVEFEKLLYYWKWFALFFIASTAVYFFKVWESYKLQTVLLIKDNRNSGISDELRAFEI